MSSSVQEPVKTVEQVQKPAEPVKTVEQVIPAEPTKPHVLKRIWTSVVSTAKFTVDTIGWHLYYTFAFMESDMEFIGRPETTEWRRLSRSEKFWILYLFFLRVLVWLPLGAAAVACFTPFSLIMLVCGGG